MTASRAPQEEAEFDVVTEAYDQRDGFSRSASENARKLCFVGYGLIALFGGLNKKEFTLPLDLPNRLIWAGLLLTLALAADLLQYVYGSLAFGILGRTEEKKSPTARRQDFPAPINWATNFFFWTKLIITMSAWVLLLIHLAYNVK